MPQDARALTRAARARAKTTGEPYTKARDAVLAIRELADENDWSFEDAQTWYDDPANQQMCEVCGWTYGMVCPECAKGCGCSVGCSGWRHREYRHEDDEVEDEWECECGAHPYNNGYGCVCP
jgi:hypothetical protein